MSSSERQARIDAEERLKDAQKEVEALKSKLALLENEVKELRPAKSLVNIRKESDTDKEIAKRLERLRILVQEVNVQNRPPSPHSAFKGTRADQIKESEGLVARKDKPGKFNMLKYTSIGTVYGEEPDHFAEEEIPPGKVLEFEDLDFGDEIGTGAFSWVYSGKWKDREVAIKKLSFEALEVEDFLIMFKKEVALLSILNHPNIVDFIGVVTFPSYYMITAYMHEGALDEILADPDTPMPWSRRASLLTDVARGMNYLHTRVPRVIHRDLKCGNVLVDKEWRAAVTDFGLSVTKVGRMDPADLKFAYNIRMSLENAMTGRHQSYVKPLQSPVGTFPYIAPELLAAKPYNEMVDVYSYSMVLWHMMTRQPPWVGLSNSVFAAKELTETYRPPIPSWCPDPLKKLIEACWEDDAYKRPTFESILVTLEKEIVPLNPVFPNECK